MTHVPGMRDHDCNPLDAVINKSKTALFFLALILPDDSPRTVVVNRGTLTRIPDEGNYRKSMIRRPIKKVLRIRLRRDSAAILLYQPSGLFHKTPDQRLDRKN